MARIIVRAVVFLGSAAAGLLVAWLVLRPDLGLRPLGFVVAVVVFALAQSLVAPIVTKSAGRYAPTFLGGAGLVSTFIALVLATWLADGLTIHGLSTWLFATLIVWVVGALATMVLPSLMTKDAKKSTARK